MDAVYVGCSAQPSRRLRVARAPAYAGSTLTKEQAFSIARQAVEDASLEGARETEHGWYFRLKTNGLGCHGLVVSKASGKVLTLGSAFPVERDLALYDKGYQFARYDLVVTSVARRGATCETLLKLGISVVEPTFEHGSVWRVPRRLTQQELFQRLEAVPCVFEKATCLLWLC